MIAGLKPYPEYKDSGVEWLGEVPVGWEVRRVKTLFRERNERGRSELALLAATQREGVIRKEDYGERTVVAMNDLESLKLVRPGDFVISLRSFQGGIERAYAEGIISPAYTILSPIETESRDYLTRLLKSRVFIDGLNVFVTGIRQGQNIDYSRLGRSAFPMPPLPERRLISAFVGKFELTASKLIAAKQRLIELLEEEKQAIIHRAVTRGLDPNVRLKPSGVDWLGDVPEHWEVQRLRTTADRVIGGVWGDDPDGEDDLACIRVADFDRDRLIARPDNPTLRSITSSERSSRLLMPGDLLLEKSGGGEKHPVGAVVRFDAPFPAVSSNFVTRLSPRQGQDSRFLAYLHAVLYRRGINIRSIKQTTGIQNLSTTSYLSERVPVPGVDEQRQIADSLDRRTAELRRGQGVARRQISLLHELRTRLISDVVTGKLDVREAAARLPGESVDGDEDGALTEAIEEVVA